MSNTIKLKKITLDQSTKYFSQSEDLLDSPIRFYTKTEDKDGWDSITYFTSRRKDIYANRGEADQWVYILSNPALPNMLKIGYTKNEPEVRAKQISASTGVALPYKVEWAFQCFNGEQLEQEVHAELASYRVNQNREFFDIPLAEAQEAIEKIGKQYM
tara:strand:- start:1673 stop:2146 length:474 start_codon:yes stop_codon:yes gene_type:complete